MLKTFKKWKTQTQGLTKYLKRGDTIDGDFFDHIIGVVPPAFQSKGIVQMGEPCSHVGGKPTFVTIKKTGATWTYAGLCLLGQTQEATRC